MATYGYLRVSTINQSNEKFKDDILRYANSNKLGNVEWVEEKVSGKVDWRKRSLGELVDGMNCGDVLIVPELSRLGRSISMIFQIVEACQAKGIEIHALKQNMVIKGASKDITTTVLLSTMALCSELERDFIAIRTKEALAVKKAQGVKLGRPTGVGKSKLDEYAAEIQAFKATGSTLTWIAKKYNTTPITVSRWLERHPA